MKRPLSDRFEEKVVRGDGCHIWTGAILQTGYGQIARGGSLGLVSAHRAAWELANGLIPPGMVVMHVCDNRRCVRVEHLRLGTTADNVADRVAKGRGSTNGYDKKTHCKHGHAFTPENTAMRVDRRGQSRCCLTCRQRDNARRRAA